MPPRPRYRIEEAARSVLPPGPAAPVAADPWPDERARADLATIRDAIDATRREIADFRGSPSGGMRRAASELDEVAVATERATTAILSAVEEIELQANLLRGGAGGRDPAAAILDRVLALYEACNFQDLTGQRIRKVVSTMKQVEERLDRVAAAATAALPALASLPGPGGTQLSGPSLPGDEGHVSQSDVDAFFR